MVAPATTAINAANVRMLNPDAAGMPCLSLVTVLGSPVAPGSCQHYQFRVTVPGVPSERNSSHSSSLGGQGKCPGPLGLCSDSKSGNFDQAGSMIVCSECGAIRKDVNHWFLVWTDQRGRRFCFMHTDGYPERANQVGVLTLCGEWCLHQAIQKCTDVADVPGTPVRQPSTDKRCANPVLLS